MQVDDRLVKDDKYILLKSDIQEEIVTFYFQNVYTLKKNYGAKDCQINQQGTVAKATAPVNYSVLSGVSKNTQIGFVIIHNNLTKFYELFYIFL